MRGAIIDAIYARMAQDESLFFLNADMGINLVEKLAQAYPDRYLNVGIAEQNMVGVAAGLANAGFLPLLYTISNFLVHRCLEQIRNDICLHEYPITLIGTSTGFDNAPLGPTHHMVDDWGVIKSLHGIEVYCPSSLACASKLIDRILASQRPAYVRVPKGAGVSINAADDWILIAGEKRTTLLVCYGGTVADCLAAQSERPQLSVLILNKLHTLNVPIIRSVLAEYENIMTVEDHFAHHGIYSSIIVLLMNSGINRRVISMAPDNYEFTVGASSCYFSKKHFIAKENIINKLDELEALGKV